jgi:hypothetical protein
MRFRWIIFKLFDIYRRLPEDEELVKNNQELQKKQTMLFDLLMIATGNKKYQLFHRNQCESYQERAPGSIAALGEERCQEIMIGPMTAKVTGEEDESEHSQYFERVLW